MLTNLNWGEMLDGGIFKLGLDVKDYVIIAVSVIAVAVLSKLSQKMDVRSKLCGKTTLSWLLAGAVLIAILLFGAYGIGYDASQFIYTQF